MKKITGRAVIIRTPAAGLQGLLRPGYVAVTGDEPALDPLSSIEPGSTLDRHVSPAGAGFDPGSSREDAEVSMLREPPGLALADYSSIEIGAVAKHTTMITNTAATMDLCVPC